MRHSQSGAFQVKEKWAPPTAASSLRRVASSSSWWNGTRIGTSSTTLSPFFTSRKLPGSWRVPSFWGFASPRSQSGVTPRCRWIEWTASTVAVTAKNLGALQATPKNARRYMTTTSGWQVTLSRELHPKISVRIRPHVSIPRNVRGESDVFFWFWWRHQQFEEHRYLCLSTGPQLRLGTCIESDLRDLSSSFSSS